MQLIAKKVIRQYFGHKRFHSKPFTTQQKGILPSDGTAEMRPFQVIDKDCASPIMCHNKTRGEKKMYMLLFTCSLTRVTTATANHRRVHKSIEEDPLKDEEFIARRYPQTKFSNNAKIYVAAPKWIRKINKSEILHLILSTRCINWKFSLYQATWWGGKLKENTLYKTVRKSTLEWKELEVFTYIEITLNSRSLTYIEDIQFPVLIPNLLVLGLTPIIPNKDPTDTENKNYERDKSKYKDARKQHGRDAETNT